MSETIEIYVKLIDEGVDVWLQTTAKHLGDGRYLLERTPDYDPKLEKWELIPGTIVSTRMRRFEGERKKKRIAVHVEQTTSTSPSQT
ncbi:MAG: hypothetical protein HRU32_02805 [Rhodobacteraceae bacterium]|nr:hypothetical protein [Paracoccaceae bacterium]